MKIKILLLLMLLLTAFTVVRADGAFIHPPSYNQDIYEPNQQAIIKYNNGTETLILRAVYKGSNISEFIWIIPMPNIPTASTSEPQLFTLLSRITAPQVKRSINPSQFFGTFGSMSAGESKVSPDDYMVDLVSRQQLGVYDVSVLTAKKAQTMIDWFNTRGYSLDQEALPMIEEYLNNGWYFVAVRVNLTNQSDEMRYTGVLQPLQFVFNSSSIVYPLKISSLNPGDTEVLVYIFADNKLKPNSTQYRLEYAGEYAGNIGNSLSGFIEKDYFVTKIRMKFNNSYKITDDLMFVDYGDDKAYRMVVDEHGNPVSTGILQMLWDALKMLFHK